ncbi:uncharacterized protein LOC143911325 [Arctopsyche grandis]|uniref:uncharacterized protein LOC143911325 n=1 Tax=Arctopsyche grandis TaxID=121162 RepID=UPI00406D8308
MAVTGYFIAKGMIFLACFLAICQVTQSYTVSKNEKKPYLAPACNSTEYEIGIYQMDCNGVNVNDLTRMIEVELATSPTGKRNIDFLTIRDLKVDSGKLSQNWISTTSFRISYLDLISTEIKSIENNAFKGYAFEELILLQLQEMKIDTLEEGTFEGLQSLRGLSLSKCEVNNINQNALKAVASNLELMYMVFMKLPLNPKNLTGSVPLPRLTEVGLVYNKIPSLDAESFSHINPEFVYLHWNQIESIGCGTFEKMTSLKKLWLDSNRLTTMNSCVLGNAVINSLGQNVMTIGDNSWNCNCELNWLKQLKIQKKLYGIPRCASHSNLPFEEVNFC